MSTRWDPDADRIQQYQDSRVIPTQRQPVEDTCCPHGRSVLLDCAACPDPQRTVEESPWLLLLLLLAVIVATYGVVLLIGPGL